MIMMKVSLTSGGNPGLQWELSQPQPLKYICQFLMPPTFQPPKKPFYNKQLLTCRGNMKFFWWQCFGLPPTLFLPTGCDAEQGGQTVDSTMHCLCQLDKISFEVVLKFEICYVFYNLHIEQKKCTTLLSLQYLHSVLIPRVWHWADQEATQLMHLLMSRLTCHKSEVTIIIVIIITNIIIITILGRPKQWLERSSFQSADSRL